MTEAAAPDPDLSEPLVVHRQPVYRYIHSMVRDSTEAEDLTQETLLRAHRKLSSLADHTKLVPWLYRIATNVCHDRFRQTSYRNRPESFDAHADGNASNEAADTAPRLDTVIEQKEMSDCVQEYLANLSDSYRSVILLHDMEGMTNPEIAAMLDVSLATVKIRLHRAREQLRTALKAGCSFSCDDRGVMVCDRKPQDSND